MKLLNPSNRLITVNVPNVGLISVMSKCVADFSDAEAWRGKAHGLVEAVEVKPSLPKPQKKTIKWKK